MNERVPWDHNLFTLKTTHHGRGKLALLVVKHLSMIRVYSYFYSCTSGKSESVWEWLVWFATYVLSLGRHNMLQTKLANRPSLCTQCGLTIILLTQCTSTSLIHPINWLNHYVITKHTKLAYMPHYYTEHGLRFVPVRPVHCKTWWPRTNEGRKEVHC